MAITNQIAEFGKRGTGNPGAGIGYGLRAQEMRNQNQRYQNEIARMDAEKKAQKAAELQAQERDYFSRFTDTLSRSPAEARPQVYLGGLQRAQQMGFDINGAPPQYSDEVLYKLQGAFGSADRRDTTPAGIQEIQYMSNVLANPDQYPKTTVDFVRVKAGLDPRAQGSADMTIAGKGLTDVVAESKANIEGRVSGAKEKSKLEQQNIYRPKIERAITEAKVAAQARGETLSELQQAQAALPGLKETIENLRELAPIATSTLGGKIFDMAVKEAGFGATKGSTARAKWIAIVDNQVLPLLKQTFGAAFTVQEGERLRATLGDPDSTPQEKMAQLDAFLANKYREIETKQRYLSGGQPESGASVRQPQQTSNAAAPSQQPQQGVDAELLQYMTPEERALFE